MFVKKSKTRLDGDIQDAVWESVQPPGHKPHSKQKPLRWVIVLLAVVFLLFATGYLTITGVALVAGVEHMVQGDYLRGFWHMSPFFGGLYLGGLMFNDFGKSGTQ